MPKKIVVTGATGLIGTQLVRELTRLNHQVIVFTTSPAKAKEVIKEASAFVPWKPEENGEWAKFIDGTDAVIHLAGANLFNKRWTESYKKEIMKSREAGTRGIVNAIINAQKKPEVLISSSAIGYYGSSETDVFNEESLPGNDFLARVCVIWEKEAAAVEQYGVRRVSLRQGIVLDKNEGALSKMLMQFKFFLGGPLGSGRQWFSWIHIQDLVKIYERAIWNEKLSGPVNASAPIPVTMEQFAHTLGKVMNRPSIFKYPETLLKLFLGEFASTITNGQKVIPQKLINDKYEFIYPELEFALRHLVGKGINLT